MFPGSLSLPAHRCELPESAARVFSGSSHQSHVPDRGGKCSRLSSPEFPPEELNTAKKRETRFPSEPQCRSVRLRRLCSSPTTLWPSDCRDDTLGVHIHEDEGGDEVTAPSNVSVYLYVYCDFFFFCCKLN